MAKTQLESKAVPIFSPSELFAEANIHLKANMPILITGKPGQGKSTIIEQLCQELEYDLMISHPVVDSPIDYKGMPALLEVMVIPNGQSQAKPTKQAEFLPFGELRNLIDATKPTVHFADDLGPSAKMVQAAYGQLLLNRAINNHAVSDHVRFVAATNRKQDKSGVQGIIEMLKDRFHTICELQNSVEDWVKWAITSKKIPYELISFVRYMPEVLDDFEPTADMSRRCTPRGLQQIADKMNAGLPKHMQHKSFTGTVGVKVATDLVGFLRIYQDLPDPDKVIMDPKNAEIPDIEKTPGNLYALCGALSARATQNSIERIITYANRLPDEFSVMLVNDSTQHNSKLCQNPSFLEWVSDHQDVLV